MIQASRASLGPEEHSCQVVGQDQEEDCECQGMMTGTLSSVRVQEGLGYLGRAVIWTRGPLGGVWNSRLDGICLQSQHW